MHKHNLPFSAISGHDDLKKALMLLMTGQDIRSMIIIGGTGTGKSVLARSIGSLTGADLIHLPVNTSGEHIFGTIDIERSIKEGATVPKHGLLEEADGKILCIEDIHLHEPALLTEIFNYADTCPINDKSKGLSLSRDFHFKIVATLNTTEGTLPDHLLDRFDLSGYCNSLENLQDRTELIRRAVRLERIGIRGLNEFVIEDNNLAEKVRLAAERYPFTMIPDGLLDLISDLSDSLGVAGHRGGISLARAARAYAAFEGRDQVTLDDLKTVVPFALMHRKHDTNPRAPPQKKPEQPPENEPDQDPGTGNSQESGHNDLSPEPDDTAGNNQGEKKEEDSSGDLSPDEIFPVRLLPIHSDLLPKSDFYAPCSQQKTGRKGGIKNGSGRYRRSVIPSGKVRDIAFDATIRAAAPYQRNRSSNRLAIVIRPSDLREKFREQKTGRTILFVLDSSGSMGAARRMSAVKGAILSLLKDAYVNRDFVALICFRGRSAEVVLQPTRSGDLAYKRLQDLPTGGKTPLAEAISGTISMIKQIQMKTPGDRPLVIMVSDGRTNVPISDGDPIRDAFTLASVARTKSADYLVIDTECGYPKIGLAKKLSDILGGDYVKLENLEANVLSSLVKTKVS